MPKKKGSETYTPQRPKLNTPCQVPRFSWPLVIGMETVGPTKVALVWDTLSRWQLRGVDSMHWWWAYSRITNISQSIVSVSCMIKCTDSGPSSVCSQLRLSGTTWSKAMSISVTEALNKNFIIIIESSHLSLHLCENRVRTIIDRRKPLSYLYPSSHLESKHKTCVFYIYIIVECIFLEIGVLTWREIAFRPAVRWTYWLETDQGYNSSPKHLRALLWCLTEPHQLWDGSPWNDGITWMFFASPWFSWIVVVVRYLKTIFTGSGDSTDWSIHRGTCF